jgi:predicted O-methyltransferase YrrM
MKILEIGTGWGLFAIEMAKQLKRGKIVGIDITLEDLSMARISFRFKEWMPPSFVFQITILISS